MPEPYKVISTFQYTEETFFDADGTELGTLRIHDDTLCDQSGYLPLTESENKEWSR